MIVLISIVSKRLLLMTDVSRSWSEVFFGVNGRSSMMQISGRVCVKQKWQSRELHGRSHQIELSFTVSTRIFCIHTSFRFSINEGILELLSMTDKPQNLTLCIGPELSLIKHQINWFMSRACVLPCARGKVDYWLSLSVNDSLISRPIFTYHIVTWANLKALLYHLIKPFTYPAFACVAGTEVI